MNEDDADGSDTDASSTDTEPEPSDTEPTTEEPESEPDHFGNCRLGDPSAFDPPVAAPRVSLGKPIVASPGIEKPEGLVNGDYHNSAQSVRFGTPTAEAPVWVAIDMGEGSGEGPGEGPSRLLLAWFDVTSNTYRSNGGASPVSYRIEVSANSSDGSDGEWTPVHEVIGNTYRFRGHSFAFSGQRWVRFVITEALPDKTILLDEIALHDVSDSGDALDSWAFIGDSITLGAFKRDFAEADTFDELVAASKPEHFPAWVNLGVGNEFLAEGLARLESDLATYSEYRQVGVAFGTNDAWGNKAVGNFEAQLVSVVEALIAADRVPMLARIPYVSGSTHRTLPDFNRVIDDVQTRYQLPCGPDLYSWFKDHPEELSADGVHPSRTGYISINRLWAEAALAFYGQ